MLLDYYVEKSVLVVDIEEKGILGLPFKKLKDVKFLKNFFLWKKGGFFKN
jgi:hypothetical protein